MEKCRPCHVYFLFVGKSVHFLTDKGYIKPIRWWSEHKKHLRWGITWKNVLNKNFNKKVGSVKCKLDTKLMISRTALLVPVSFDKERLVLTIQNIIWAQVYPIACRLNATVLMLIRCAQSVKSLIKLIVIKLLKQYKFNFYFKRTITNTTSTSTLTIFWPYA